MKSILSSLLPLTALCADSPTEKERIKNLDLRRPYINYGEMRSKWWHFGGDCYVDTMSSVRLTPDVPSKRGWIWSKVILSQKAWEIEFEFKVSGM